MPIMQTLKNKINNEYVVGLVDGEGSFTVYIRDLDNPKPIKRRVVVEPKFYLKLVEEDKDILYALRDFFGCGSVYFQKDSRPNHKNCYRYEVYKRDDLLKTIIPFFERNPLRFPSKARDFKIFCILMDMINSKLHLDKDGLKKMLVIKQKMH
jgi:hypothetical protein